MFTIAPETAVDIEAREALWMPALVRRAMPGPANACAKVALPAEGLAFVAHIADKLVGTLRFWHVMAGDRAALMLGPLAVDPNFRSLGLGKAMMRQGLDAAQAIGHEAIILVGDAPYYAPFGFVRSLTEGLAMPGPLIPRGSSGWNGAQARWRVPRGWSGPPARCRWCSRKDGMGFDGPPDALKGIAGP